MSGYPSVRIVSAAIVMVMLIHGCGRAVTQHTDDATITTRVKTALLNDPTVNGSTIEISTDSGVVTLSGQVRTARERERAVAIARSTAGVADVRSTLQIVAAGG